MKRLLEILYCQLVELATKVANCKLLTQSSKANKPLTRNHCCGRQSNKQFGCQEKVMMLVKELLMKCD